MFGSIYTYIVDPTGKPNVSPSYQYTHGSWISSMSRSNRGLLSLDYELSTPTVAYEYSSYIRKWLIKLLEKENNNMPNQINCVHCDSEITNPDFKVILYQPGYESIDIGPYCPTCFVKVKVCSGCQHPLIGEENIKHYGNGRHFCNECASSLEMCGVCGSEERIKSVVGGKKYCPSCYDKEFFKCGVCGEDHLKANHEWSELERQTKKGIWKKYGEICKSCHGNVQSKFKTYAVSKCRNCSGVYAASKDQIYCDNCLSGFSICGVCNQKHPHVSHYSTDDGNDGYICNGCKISKYSTCSTCGRLTTTPTNLLGAKKTHKLCTLCSGGGYGECSGCHSVRKLRDGYCEKCTQTYVNNTCFDCGSVKDFNGQCRSCGDTRVYGYSTKPDIFFHNTEKDKKRGETLYFGFENEMHFPGNSSGALSSIYKAYDPTMLIAKDDSSIPGESFEVVTQPMTLRFFNKTKWASLFTDSPTFSTSCGLHIHVDRGAFKGDLHIFKVCKFVAEEETFLNNVVGRSAGAHNNNFSHKPSKTVKEAKKGNASRGCRVNLTNNVTIEFRMFATCTTEYQLRYRVEFLHALIKFAEESAIKDINKGSLKSYIAENKKRYPTIHQFLCQLTS